MTPLHGLLTGEVSVATAGVGLFAEALRAQAVPVTEVDWRPPMPGTEADLATVMADPRRPAANAEALQRMTSAGAELVDVRPAAEVLGLEKGRFLHAGPPMTWAQASGPMRGALIGAMLFEGLAESRRAGRGGAGRRVGHRASSRATTAVRWARWPAWSARRCGCSCCATRCTTAPPPAR